MQALSEASAPVTERAYAQQSQQAGEGEAGETEAASDAADQTETTSDNTVDAEFEEVKDEEDTTK